MPVEPVTPPDSAAWRVIHFPVMLAVIAAGLLFAGAIAIGLVGYAVRSISHVPAARYLVSPVGAMIALAGYVLFVRIVERRPVVEELDSRGWLQELGSAYGGGLLLSLATFAILDLLGGVRILGFNPPEVMLLPFVVQLSTALILELVVCGIGFRLIERLLGSWLTLLLTFGFFGAARLIGDVATPSAVFTVALQAVLLFAAPYMMTRRLWAAIGLSAGWKFAQIGLYGIASSESGPHGFVLSAVSGPDWLTGGIAGTDASVPALAVNTLVIAVLLILAVRRGRIVRPAWRRGRTNTAVTS